MARKTLHPDLLQKMAAKLGKSVKYVREQTCRRAGKQSISSAAAQLIWAKQLGIGVASVLRKVTPEVRQEVRSVGSEPSLRAPRTRQVPSPKKRKPEAIGADAIKVLLQDQELYGRCKNMLRGTRHFDQVIREATTVLDDRLKRKTGITNMNPENLVGKTIHPEPSQAVIEVSADRAEQLGFHSICKGIVLAFRNKAHHSLTDSFTREDALKFCRFMDMLLGMMDRATLHLDRAKSRP